MLLLERFIPMILPLTVCIVPYPAPLLATGVFLDFFFFPTLPFAAFLSLSSPLLPLPHPVRR